MRSGLKKSSGRRMETRIIMNRRKNWRGWAAVCLACALGFAGCGGTDGGEDASEALSDSVSGEAQADEAKEQRALRGSGSLEYGPEAGRALTKEQEKLLLDYMNLYFASLQDLESRGTDGLFSDEKQEELAQEAVGLQISLRKMQEADYTLASWSYVLTLEEVAPQEDGTIHILAQEDSVQNFSQTPDRDSRRYGSPHQFVLEEKEGAWKLESHMSFDPVWLMLWNEEGELEAEDVMQKYADAAPEYLERAGEALSDREKDREREAEAVEAQEPYDRQAALRYARRYVQERNGEWEDYGSRGGNCQNYASQVLHAGGIPMDIYGDAVWKWYWDEVSNSPGARGRSSSWTGVDEFMAYAEANTGYGLAAEMDAPYYDGEPGDLLHMGMDGDWGHTVVVSAVVTDEEGRTVDYLVDSNTGDLSDYPASLYGYPEIVLTKIAGWNAE